MRNMSGEEKYEENGNRNEYERIKMVKLKPSFTFFTVSRA